jgi:hypothetical protein
VTGGLFACAASLDITPPVGFPLGGYILRTGVSVGVLDPIKARLLSVGDGRVRCLLISLDWIYVDGRWSQALKEDAARALDTSPDRVIVTATHTHSGPGVFRSWTTPDAREGEYLGEVRARVVDAARRLAAGERPVSLSVGTARVEGIGADRNDPHQEIDDRLTLVSLISPDGDDDGRLINYACHPTVLGPENLRFSSDWVGAGLSLVDRAMGGTSLFLNGGAADVSTRFTRKGRGVEEIGRVAEIFLDAVRRARGGGAVSAGGIRVVSRRVAVKYKPLPDPAEATKELEAADRRIAEARSRGAVSGEIRRLESIREGALVSLTFASLGGFDKVFGVRPMEAIVTLVRIGSIGIVFFPGEVTSDTAGAISAAAPFYLMVAGYADDYFGYLAPNEGGYESAVAVLSSESIERIVGAARDLIKGDS